MIYHDLPIKNADFRGFDVVKPLVFDVCFFLCSEYAFEDAYFCRILKGW